MVPYGIGGEIQRFPFKYKVNLTITDPHANFANIEKFIKIIPSLYSDLIISEPKSQGNTIIFEVGSVVPTISEFDITRRIRNAFSLNNDRSAVIDPRNIIVEISQDYYRDIRRILSTVADLVESKEENSVMDIAIVRHTNIPREVLQFYLDEMENMGLIQKVRPKPSGASIDLYNITNQGLQVLNNEQ